jgi:hypothetical protein
MAEVTVVVVAVVVKVEVNVLVEVVPNWFSVVAAVVVIVVNAVVNVVSVRNDVVVELKVVVPGTKIVEQASATSPPDWFWSPSCTMICILYVWPVWNTPLLMRASVSHRTSAPNPWFVSPPGGVSPPSKFQPLLAGSVPVDTVLAPAL